MVKLLWCFHGRGDFVYKKSVESGRWKDSGEKSTVNREKGNIVTGKDI